MNRTWIRFVVLMMAVIFRSALFAGSVDWNSFRLESTGEEGCYYLSWINPVGDECRADSFFVEILLIHGMPGGELYLMGQKRGVGLGDTFVGNMLEARAGDVVNFESSRLQGEYFLHDKLDNEPYSENWIEVEDGRNYYLAIVAGNLSDYHKGGPYDNVAYGWVNIGVGEDGELSVLASAMGLEGQSMIVGAIPEPTTAMLLLIGVAGLALRRSHCRC